MRVRFTSRLFFTATFLLSSQAKGQVDITENLSISGEVRGRYESLDGQFRAGTVGSDQLLLFRSLVHGKYQLDSTEIGLELQDSRTYLSDSETPLSSSFTNTLDVLQVYVAFNSLPGLLGTDSKQKLTLGRQTITVGSKRQIQRVSFANVVKSYTGVYSKSVNAHKDELHAFYAVPIERLPTAKEQLKDNKIELDKEQWHRKVWGLHYRRADSFANIDDNIWGELFAYGFDESDQNNKQTANRHYLTLGGRLYKKWQNSRFDYDIELAHRTGSRHASSKANDTVDLNVNANMVFVRLGYTFGDALNTNLALQYYYTSGDKNSQDNNFEQYENMFGGRRTDLNNTSIHGPLTPANLSAVGARIEFRPNTNWDARVHYSAAYLSSKTDSFVIAKYRDESGQSGDFIGHTVDARFRYWWDNKTWTLELGLSMLLPGSYLERVREQEQLATDTTKFGYVQLGYKF